MSARMIWPKVALVKTHQLGAKLSVALGLSRLAGKICRLGDHHGSVLKILLCESSSKSYRFGKDGSSCLTDTVTQPP
jgi:hypothetical protein